MRRFAIAFLTAALFLTTVPTIERVAAQQQGQAFTFETLSVDFPGGTVSEYIALLKKTGKSVNVVSTERASKQQLAPISLNQVTVGVAIFAIEAASTSGTGSWRIDVIGVPGPRMPYPVPGEAYSVDFYPFGKRGEDVIVESFSLQMILQRGTKTGLDAKVALTAIETGLKLQNEPGQQAADLQFHQDSGLLFVRGSSADVRLVGSIVARLQDDARARSAAAERRAYEEALRAVAVKEASLEIQMREAELVSATRTFEMAQKLAEKGTVPTSELSKLELEVARARIRLDQARLGMERASIAPPAAEPDGRPQQAESPPTPAPSTAPSPKRPNPK